VSDAIKEGEKTFVDGTSAPTTVGEFRCGADFSRLNASPHDFPCLTDSFQADNKEAAGQSLLEDGQQLPGEQIIGKGL
jgi:hypothetical protein